MLAEDLVRLSCRHAVPVSMAGSADVGEKAHCPFCHGTRRVTDGDYLPTPEHSDWKPTLGSVIPVSPATTPNGSSTVASVTVAFGAVKVGEVAIATVPG